MKGAVLQKVDRGYFTNLKDVFAPLQNIQNDYNWLVTDYVCNHYPVKEIAANSEYTWITGGLLTEIVQENDIQFIWGVLSAFDKNKALNDIIKYPMPYAEGNPALWRSDISLQHPYANIEVVSWDSSLMLIKSKNDHVIDAFLRHYPEAIDLEMYLKD